MVTLDPTIGSEIRKTRPCLIVSPDELHASVKTVIIAPMTTGTRPKPFRVPIEFQQKAGLVLLDQLRSISPMRLRKRLGTASIDTQERVLHTLQEMFAR